LEEIKKLIKEFEKEQTDLRRLIDEAVKNGEYLIAHFHSGAIEYVNRQLQTLRNLDDKWFDSKKFLKAMIERANIQLDSDYPDKLKEYLSREIEKLESELHALEQQDKVSTSESSILMGYLDLLVSRKIKGVKVVLKKSSNFVLDIRNHRSGMRLQIPHLRSLRKDFIIHEENIQKFFGLGFTVDSSDTRLTLFLAKRDKEYLLTDLRIIIVKIVFEIFYFKEFDGDTHIEIQK